MTAQVAAGPREQRHREVAVALRRLPWLLGAAVVGCQIAFPFTGGGTPELTVVTVWLFALTSIGHALVERGPLAATALFMIAGGIGLLAESVGVRTGIPFGEYEYGSTLGWQLFGVPVVVPLAWTMMAYLALLVGRRLAGRAGRLGTVLVGAWALASWDVFLDPQMVDAGHWRWAAPEPGLPGVEGIPLTNFAGWLLVALLVVALLDAVLPDGAPPDAAPPDGVLRDRPGRPADDRLPAALYLWTYGSSVLAHLVFFGRPPVALAGGLAMGLVAVPFGLSLWRGRRSAARGHR